MLAPRVDPCFHPLLQLRVRDQNVFPEGVAPVRVFPFDRPEPVHACPDLCCVSHPVEAVGPFPGPFAVVLP